MLATTRQPDRVQSLLDHGVDHALVDDGRVADQVHDLLGAGVDAALELVGTPTLPDTLAPPASTARCASPGCCRTSGRSRTSTPSTTSHRVRLTGYGGGSADLPPDVLQDYLDRLAPAPPCLGPIRVHQLDDIREAHLDLEHNRTFGKHVVLLHR